MRGASNVSDDARAAVFKAADELAYHPNQAARTLVTRRTDSVAFLVAETEDRLFHDPYFLAMMRGAHAEVAAAGLQLIFAVASTRGEAENFEHYAGGGHVDGVLLISLHGDDELPGNLERLGVPTVVNGRPLSEAATTCYVDSDNVAGGRLATERLLDRGARRIATITGPLDMAAGLDRVTGYREALRTAPGDRPDLIGTGDFSIAGGHAAMLDLLDRDPAIDGVFAASDLTALGALGALRARGRRVPDDVAVVGFDDIPQAAIADPPLTTIRQPIGEVGRTMARRLLERIGGQTPPQSTVLPVDLVARASG
jgi:DNA-binding LacI/PurR family transcriptional regulator